MIIPIRCFTCGKPLAHLWEKYKERVEAGEQPGKVLDELGIKDMCCRALFLGHVDLIKSVAVHRK